MKEIIYDKTKQQKTIPISICHDSVIPSASCQTLAGLYLEKKDGLEGLAIDMIESNHTKDVFYAKSRWIYFLQLFSDNVANLSQILCTRFHHKNWSKNPQVIILNTAPSD